MKWYKKYALGMAAIDAQHKQLFRLSDDLDMALQNGIRTEDLDTLLIRLKHYAARNFTLKERQMADLNYKNLHKNSNVRGISFSHLSGFVPQPNLPGW